jgi:periodic tryptophan protein 1
MLTCMQWLPLAAMKSVPLRATDTLETAREKIRKQNPDYFGSDDVVDVAADQEDHRVDDDADGSDDEGDLFSRICGGDGILEQVESDDEDEIDDTTFKETDYVFIATRADQQEPKLELYIYDEPADNIYVHHDMTVTAFPLTCSWLTDGTMSLAAVGTMLPFIEIWPLDVIDAVEPVCLLGGCVATEDNYRRKLKKDKLKPESHTDAVITLQWNTVAQQFLVSGGADEKIKIWDLNSQTCVGTYVEPAKIQTVDWHRTEAHLLLSGAYDGTVVLRDCRRPTEASLRWQLGDTLEHVEYSHENLVLASTTAGHFHCYDPRKLSDPLWTVHPHDGETTFAVSRLVDGLVATGGKEGNVSLWDLRGSAQPPVPIVSRNYKTGAVLSMAFHPNVGNVLGACGVRGEPLVYTVTQDIASVFPTAR